MAGFVVMHESQEEYDAKIRAKAIEEFAEVLRKESLKNIDRDLWVGTILHIAKELKGER